jgi:hypothetical protein
VSMNRELVVPKCSRGARLKPAACAWETSSSRWRASRLRA